MTSALVSLSIVVGVVIAAAVVWAVVEGYRYRRGAERLIADYDHRLDDADIVPVDPYLSRFVD